MEFANIAEFRQNASKVFERVRRTGEVIVLRNGRPVGLLVAADAETVDSFRVALQRTRAQMAIERLRRAAKDGGLDQLTGNDVSGLVHRARRERARRR